MSIDFIMNISPKSSFDWTTIILSFMTCCVALQQWISTEKQRKQDLFEKRYNELFLPILNDAEKYNVYKQNESEIDFEEKEKREEEFRLRLHKYKFLIKEEDFERIINLYEELCNKLKDEKKKLERKGLKNFEYEMSKILKEIEHLYNEMECIIKKYLQIEKTPNFYISIKNIIVWIYKFFKFPNKEDFND